MVRSADSGAADENTVDTLSESEWDVTGLVFALAGYLTHDIYEECPYLVVTLLPKDAAGVEEVH
jgi:hypothetical protein